MLQYGFSREHPEAVFNRRARAKKAQKILAILSNHFGRLENLVALEIGCAAGFGSTEYGSRFKTLVSADVDLPAVRFASANNPAHNIEYIALDAQRLPFPDASFDVVICSHVYEHVPDSDQLMREIWRILTPLGACLFAAGNRFQLIEPHYRLPLLSVVPKPIAHVYLRAIRRGNFYFENHLSYWGLSRLVSAFQRIDYTVAVVDEPLRYEADDVLCPNTLKHYIAKIVVRMMYWFCPTYLWVLVKKKEDR